MIKDQASALREMIRLKKEKKSNKKKEVIEGNNIQTTELNKIEEVKFEKTEGDLMIEEFFSSIGSSSIEVICEENQENVELNINVLEEVEKEIKIIGVCGCSNGIDRSGFLINTAITFKEQGKTPLILSLKANDSSSVFDWCHDESDYSLEDVINGEKTIEEVVVSNSEGIYFANIGSNTFAMKEWDESSKSCFELQL